MLRVTTADERVAAVLHDVVEGTTVGLEQLRSEGFSTAVLDAVSALTKRQGETESRRPAVHQQTLLPGS